MNHELHWLNGLAATLDEDARGQAEARQASLTKPPGALGRLEALAVRLASLQGTARPRVDRIHIAVFAGDHGVAAEGVSAFPQAVTVQMVRNFAQGGAAINVLARELGARLEVVNLGTVTDPGPLEGVLDLRLGAGTANLAREAAMSKAQLARALQAGRHSAQRARASGAQLFIGGEMGIGNTTSAAALACAQLQAPPAALAGPGTGLDAAGVNHKIEVIRRALALHAGQLSNPAEALRRLGGFEIAALTGAFIACAQMGLPVLVDGFISSAAALTAARLCAGAASWFVFAHASSEPGHTQILNALDAPPLLDLGMRLGEGSGAAVAVPLLRLACALHNGMATFAEAELSTKL
ncbi:MAG: nicotinate-nucleotide--dimethylbenzimidazole phosphoribosyltransferase [Gammaproteobacteria bacterium]